MRFEGNTLFVSKAEQIMIRENQQIDEAFGKLLGMSQVEAYVKAHLTDEENENFDKVNEINVQVEDEPTEE